MEVRAVPKALAVAAALCGRQLVFESGERWAGERRGRRSRSHVAQRRRVGAGAETPRSVRRSGTVARRRSHRPPLHVRLGQCDDSRRACRRVVVRRLDDVSLDADSAARPVSGAADRTMEHRETDGRLALAPGGVGVRAGHPSAGRHRCAAAGAGAGRVVDCGAGRRSQGGARTRRGHWPRTPTWGRVGESSPPASGATNRIGCGS